MTDQFPNQREEESESLAADDCRGDLHDHVPACPGEPIPSQEAGKEAETDRRSCDLCGTALDRAAQDSTCPGCGRPVRASVVIYGRAVQVGVMAITGMGALGDLAMLVADLATSGWSLRGGPTSGGLFLFCFLIGGFVGALSILIVVPCLVETDLRRSVPFVYGLSAVIVAWYATRTSGAFYPLDCAIPALIAVCLFAVAAKMFLPARRIPGPNECANCGYDLRGNTSGVCPECGQRKETH